MLRNKYVIAFFLILLIVFFLISNFLKKTFNISTIKTIFGIDGLRKINNKINFLVLGIPGGNNEGPNLSDSIMVLTYDYSKNKLYSLSIPRDIWSDTLKDRINSAYAYGEAAKPGGGIILAKAEIGAVIGVPIQYAAVINFSSFKNFIDYLGGIDVEIENSFIDKKYPIEGRENDECNGDKEYKCRYKTIRFDKGFTHMNGETTLKYVRSRNAQGAEGSDFARIKRQQLVIESLEIKLFKNISFFNFKKTKEIYEKINSSVERDFTNQQISNLAKKIILSGKPKQEKFTIPRDYFIAPSYLSYDGKYVLVPITDNYVKIHGFVSCTLNDLKEKCD
jgi:LCP family protein required for cell wall assembly